MTWRKVDDYGATNGPQCISKVYVDGCSMFRLHQDGAYTHHSEDESEIVVAATYPDVDEMKSYLSTGGLSGNEKLRDECRALWKQRQEAA